MLARSVLQRVVLRHRAHSSSAKSGQTGLIIFVLTLVFCGLSIPLTLLTALATQNSNAKEYVHDQCESVLRDEPAGTSTVTPTSTTARSSQTPQQTAAGATSEWPTVNPLAGATVADDDTKTPPWYRACFSAMRIAPPQDSSRQTSNAGQAVDCAREVALGYLGSAESSGTTGGSVSAQAMTQDIIYRASTAAVTGYCAKSGSVGVVTPTETAPSWCGQPLDPNAAPVVVQLPNDLASQGACGQRVEPSATSAGDLVFWDYRDSGDFAPTRVGLALDATEILTEESGRYVRQAMPTADDVRVKRVLGGRRS
ncbi:hypothetical protein [Nocardia altamirensis]|uniref:hypothetical protein n=1 Tax=Nocardia altamirensis TaxID=472158 RepID=UPI000840224D|nr:hypothetical protein [Nocardia altamirensis]